LLKAVETHAGQLSKATLASLRKTLELESDRDRNRFTRFPETLTARIIKNMVTLGLKMRLFPRGLGGPSHQIQAPAPRTTPKTKTKQPASALPTLVFTQKDLERFQPPKTKLSWPIKGGKIGSGFGWRSDPFTRRRSFHGAVDIGAPFGTPVYAAAGGLVVRTGWMGSCGMGVIIRHSTKMKTYYCHLSQLLASRGTVVSRGSMIGRVGSTGRSTSPHLHFVVSLYGRAVNPRDYLP
jgi:murein DD-endopeptidase MepM/ murein hydrolase activator NlpD